MMYNPVTNNFTEYTPLEPKEVKITLPSFDDPIDISSWASRVSDNGNIIASANTPQVQNFQDNILDQFNNPVTEIQEPEIMEPYKYHISDNIQGRKKQAMEYFINKGLNPIHAAGIVGNLLQESNLDPDAINPSSKAYGIAQWLGNRKTKLQQKYGKSPTFEQQLDYLWEELNSSEKSALNHLLATKSYSEAINSIMNRFERPSPREKAESIERRLKFAKELLS